MRSAGAAHAAVTRPSSPQERSQLVLILVSSPLRRSLIASREIATLDAAHAGAGFRGPSSPQERSQRGDMRERQVAAGGVPHRLKRDRNAPPPPRCPPSSPSLIASREIATGDGGRGQGTEARASLIASREIATPSGGAAAGRRLRVPHRLKRDRNVYQPCPLIGGHGSLIASREMAPARGAALGPTPAGRAITLEEFGRLTPSGRGQRWRRRGVWGGASGCQQGRWRRGRGRSRADRPAPARRACRAVRAR